MTSTEAVTPIRPSEVVAMTAAKVLGLVSPSLIPLLVPALIKSYGLTKTSAGLMVSYQMICLAGAGFLVSLIVHRIDRRLAAMGAVLVIIGGNLLCLFGGSVPTVIAGRMIIGAGEGALTAITIAAASRARIPERIFGLFAVAIGFFGAGLLWVLPRLIEAYGAGGVFIAMIALAVAVLPVLIWFPPRAEAQAAGEVRGSLFTLGSKAGLTLGAATLFSIGLGSIASFTGVIGQEIGVSQAEVGRMLALGSVLSIASPSVVMAVGGRWGTFWPMAAAAALLAGIVLTIGTAGAAAVWFVAGMIYNPAVLFLSPYQYGLMARLDPKGRISSAGPTFIKIGFAIGAAVGGMVIEHAGRQALGAFAAAWIVLGMSLYCLMAARSDRMVLAAAE